jgi:hypothetical protein
LDTVDSEAQSDFFLAIANHILPPHMGGQFDIFAPMAASGNFDVFEMEF